MYRTLRYLTVRYLPIQYEYQYEYQCEYQYEYEYEYKYQYEYSTIPRQVVDPRAEFASRDISGSDPRLAV